MLIHAKLKLKLSTPTRFCLGMYFVAGFKVIVYKSFGELTPGMHVWVEGRLNLELFNHGVEKSGVDMVVKVFIHFPLYLATLGLTL